MKVKELIERLKPFKNSDVIIKDDYLNDYDITAIRTNKIEDLVIYGKMYS